MIIDYINVSVIVIVLFMFNQIFVKQLLTLSSRTLKYISIIVYREGTSIPFSFLQPQPQYFCLPI
jgi:hypothetical protein